MQARLAAEEKAQEKKDRDLRDKIDLCIENEHVLDEQKTSFVHSIRRATLTQKVLSGKQENYLNSIHKQIVSAAVVMGVTQGLRGWFAVCIQMYGDEAGPNNTGIGSYKTAEEAYLEAREWALGEGIPIIAQRRNMHEPKGSNEKQSSQSSGVFCEEDRVEEVQSNVLKEKQFLDVVSPSAKRMKLNFRR